MSTKFEQEAMARADKVRGETNVITLARELFNIVSKLKISGLSDDETLRHDACKTVFCRLYDVERKAA